MRYLVTGGAGFIGAHLTAHLVSQGHYVTVFDKVRPKHPAPNVTSVTGSVCNYELLNEHLARHDAVFHLAAVVGFANVMRDPIRTVETGMRGTQTVLQLAHQQHKRVLFTSTSAIYGRTADEQRPVVETDPCLLGPSSVRSWSYAYAKAAEECLALAYHQMHELPVVIVRLFNTVGPWQSASAGFVLPRFVQAALKDEPIEVHDDGQQSRTFAHVQDVVEGLAALMECPEARGEIVNVGGTATTTMCDLAQTVVRVLDSKSEVRLVPDPYEQGHYENVRHRIPNLAKAHRLVGYNPTRTLEDMICDVAATTTVAV